MFFPVPLVLGIETRLPIFHLSLIWEKGPHSPKTSNKTQNYESIYRALGRCSKESSRCPLGPLYILLPRKVRTGGKNRYPRFGALSPDSGRFRTVSGQLASSDESAQTTDCGDKGGLECFLCLFVNARPKSGRNSFTTPNAILVDMEIPKLTAPSPAECWLGGCQKRDRKAPAATPPSWEIEMCRLPSSCRARMPLATAYPVRDQSPFLPELK